MRFKALLLSRVAGGLLALVLSLAADAAPILPGAVFPALALEDQHGRTVSTSANTRLVLFAADKAASDLINEVLAARPAGHKESHIGIALERLAVGRVRFFCHVCFSHPHCFLPMPI